jgi:opacity protein-like surface antigen
MTFTGISFRSAANTLLLGSLLAVWAAPPARAGDFSRMGFYLGGGASYSTDLYEDNIEDAVFGLKVDIEPTPGANARVGLRFLEFLGVEAQYEWLDEYDVDVAYLGFKGSAEVKQQTLTANLKIYPIPFWRIQPYILGGIGFQRFVFDGRIAGGLVTLEEKDTALAGRAGAGLDVYITEHIVIYGEGSVVFTDTKIDIPPAFGSDVDDIFTAGGQVGLMWRF